MDYQEQIEKVNKQHAIQGVVKTGLADILQSLNKERLHSLASAYDVPGRSKMNKGELVSALYKSITDEDRLKNILILAYPDQWDLFQTLLKEGTIQDNSIPFGHYRYLMGNCLTFSYINENKFCLVIPDEVKTLYANMDKSSFFLSRERHHLVYNYIKAMVNLYGVFTPDKLIEIFNSQNSDSIDSKEFFRIYCKFTERDQSFYLCDGYIICDFFESDDGLDDLLAKTNNKPYYIPDKIQLLNYADDTYFEMTPQLNALKEYIEKNIINDEDVVGDLIDEIQLVCSMEEPIQSVLDEFNRRDISFKNRQQVKDLMSFVTDVYNNTRIWSNCGHTPWEIHDEVERPMLKPVNSPINVMINRQAAVEKIGRNAPCPCGSGKKYKKCCGRI